VTSSPGTAAKADVPAWPRRPAGSGFAYRANSKSDSREAAHQAGISEFELARVAIDGFLEPTPPGRPPS